MKRKPKRIPYVRAENTISIGIKRTGILVDIATRVEKAAIMTISANRFAILKYNFKLSKYIVVPKKPGIEIKTFAYVEKAYDHFESLSKPKVTTAS